MSKLRGPAPRASWSIALQTWGRKRARQMREVQASQHGKATT